MAVSTLFGQPATPATLTTDASSYTMGVQFTVSQSCTFTGVWFYSPPGAGALPGSIVLYQAADPSAGNGVQLVSQTASWSGAAGSGWVRAAVTSPPTLSTGTSYKGCIFISNTGSQNFYGHTASYWTTGGAGASGITSGILTAPNNAGADGGQDSFLNSGVIGYPNTSFSAANYWVDVEVTTTSGTHSGSAARAVTATVTAAGHATHVAHATRSITAAVAASPPVPRQSLNAIPGRMVPGQIQPGDPVATVSLSVHPPTITVTAAITAKAVAGTAAGAVRAVTATISATAQVTRHRTATRTVTATVTAVKVGTHHRSVNRQTTVTITPGGAKPGNTHFAGSRPTWTTTATAAGGATRHRATARTETWNATAAAKVTRSRSESRPVTVTIAAHAVIPGGNRTAARPVTAAVHAVPAHSGHRTGSLTATATITARAGKTSPQVVLGPVVTPYATATATVTPQAD